MKNPTARKIEHWNENMYKFYLVRAAVVEHRLEVLQVDIAKLVQPEVVDGRSGDREHVLLKTRLKNNKTGMDQFQDCCKAKATNAL